MNKSEIERAAREELQLQIWQQRAALWPDGAPQPVEMLDPAIAAKILGVDYA